MKLLKSYCSLAVILALLLILGCKKETPIPSPETGNLVLKINYTFNNQKLIPDSLIFRTPTGYLVSVSRLEYYLSGFKIGATNTNNWNYLNGLKPEGNTLLLTDLAPGDYQSIQFSIGLIPELNQHGKISGTFENNQMIWPTEMGGGYHFLKFEGRYKKEEHNPGGYAIHLGTDSFLIQHQALPVQFSIHKNQTDTLHLTMQVEEWLSLPWPWDFEKDGNYTMGISEAMKKVMQNGNKVFQVD